MQAITIVSLPNHHILTPQQ